MNRRVIGSAGALLPGLLLLHLEAQTTRPGQTFRTATDVVFVDVSVRDGGRPVTDLRADDFVLTDNGVRQRIEGVEATAVPIDLTLVVDVSGNPQRPLVSRTPASKVAAAVHEDVAEIARLLRPDDRLRLFAVDRYVQQIRPLAPVTGLAAPERLEHDGLAAAYDTLAGALLMPVEPARRHVVVAAIKGRDTISALDASAVRAIAERSDALVHVVVLETEQNNEQALYGFQCAQMGYCFGTNRFWVPFWRMLVGGRPERPLLPDGIALMAGAQSTGGDLHRPADLREPTLTSTFTRAFEDFRSGYMLRYVPEGVPRGGWHIIDVRIPRARNYTVRARKGYGVEEAIPAAAPPVSGPLDTIPQLTAAYEQRRYAEVAEALRRTKDPAWLMKFFETGGNPWPAAPRREAAFAIELAEPAVFSAQPATREQAVQHLQRFARLVRHPLEPDAFERYWHFAVLCMLEGAIRPAVTSAFVDRAIARFPDEPRFQLSRAIVADQTWMSTARAPANPRQQGARLDARDVRAAYEKAVAFPSTAVEARIRLAWLLHRTRLHADALAQLDTAGAQPIAQRGLAYLHQLFLGHVLVALERPDEGIAAFRRALTIAPTAQSARVALMNTLLVRGRHEEAEALAEQVQKERTDVLDPWWAYWQGQYRMYPTAMARIRELMQ